MKRYKLREYTFRMIFTQEANTLVEEGKIEDLLTALDVEVEEDREQLTQRVKDLLSHIEEIDEIINTSLEKWSTITIAKVELALLRLATFEMKYDELAEQIAINEAVELAKKYGDEKSSKFLNGVLSKVAQNVKV